jgi:tetratricopeptide (TPR) repeat protein
MLKQEELGRFIGREKEIDLFRHWLTNKDPEAPWILYLHDAMEEREKKGGVGKTWLLGQFASLAQEIYPDTVVVHVDFFNVSDRDGVIVADHVFEALHEAYPSWKSRRFTSTLHGYRIAIREGVEDLYEIRKRMSDALIADLQELDAQLRQEHRHLLVLCDTYEMIEQNPAIAALRSDQSFPDNYEFERMGVVIAGRNALDWSQMNWRGREYEVQTLAISPFTPSETMQYFKQLSDVSSPTLENYIQPLYERTEGRPILLGLVTDVLSHRITSLDKLVSIPREDFEASLVLQINNLENPIDSVVMFMAHAYHRFNFSLLNWILRESQYTDLLQNVDPGKLSRQLYSLSFVRHPTASEGFVLHDEMRPLVNRYCWEAQDPDKRLRKLISQSVIEYYEQQLQGEDKEQLRQAYYVEMLYHKLYLNLNDGYKYFEKSFYRALNLWMNAFARSLLREVQQFVPQLSLKQRLTLRYLEARLLQIEEDPQPALEIYQELEQEADEDWLAERRPRILREKAVCYSQLNNYTEAIATFTAAMDVTEEPNGRAHLLNWMGFTYRKQGQLDTALRYYEQSLELYKQLQNDKSYAEVLINIGVVYRMQGKIEEALRRCKIGLRMRKDLFKSGKVSENSVGLSLTIIGSIYLAIEDLLKAEQAFREANDIFIRTGYKKGMATVSNRFGQISRSKGDLKTARQQFERAYYMSLGVDPDAQISSLINQGRILVQEERLDEAVSIYRQAVELARQAQTSMQETEALIELANTLAILKRDQQSQQAYAEAEKIGQKYNYYELQGRAREYQGDRKFQGGEYQAAFRFYGEACRYIAYHNVVRYQQTLRKVVDALLEMPFKEINPIIDELISYWIAQGLHVEYPDLINSCEEVRTLVR